MNNTSLKNLINERKSAVQELRALDTHAAGRKFNAAELQSEARLHDAIDKADRLIDLHANEERNRDLVAGASEVRHWLHRFAA